MMLQKRNVESDDKKEMIEKKITQFMLLLTLQFS